jgi:predicted transcriptional regulator
MDIGKGIKIYATEEARKKWEGKEKPIKNKKVSCPSCEIKILSQITEEDINDYNNKEKK